MNIRLLGPVDLVDGSGAAIPMGGAMERVLLAALALNCDELVSTSRLVDALWGERPPPSAPGTLRSYLSRLRRALQPLEAVIETAPGGFILRADPGAVDVSVVERLVAESRAARSPEEASAVLGQALRHWRGPSLGDLADRPFATADAARLDEFRISILQERITADLSCGRHEALVPELEALCTANPYREALWASRILALYRCDRQAEALRAFAVLRARLVEDLGIEPGAALRELEGAVLAQSTALDWREPARRAELRRLPGQSANPLVGRERERAVLEEAWRAATAGEPRLVLLAGEPGIGKTRLATELARDAEAQGALAVFGRTDELTSRPYGPVADAIERLLRSLATEQSDEVLRTWPAEMATLVPALAERSPARPVDVAGRDAVFEAVIGALAALSEQAPMVIVLDDLQWAGPETFQLLEYVLASPATSRVLAVGTYRDTEVGPGHLLGAVARHEDVTTIRLGPLEPAEVVQLVGDDDDLAARVHEESGGNPFVALELAAHLRHPLAARTGSLPRSVRDLLGWRFRRLGEPSHAVLRLAAVCGREFSARLLEQVLDDDDDLVFSALDAAVDALLVDDLGGGRFTFAHDLVRSALLGELSSARRARMQRGIAEVLSSQDPAEVDLDALAVHAVAAVTDGFPVAAAVDASLRCASQSLRQLAPERALEVIARASEVVGTAGRPDPQLRCELLLGEAHVREFAGDRSRLRELALSAAEEARAAGSAELLARCARQHYGWGEVGSHDDATTALCEEALAALPDQEHRWRAIVLAVLAQVTGNGRGRSGEAQALAHEAVGLARESADADALMVTLCALDQCLLGHPDVAARLAVNTEIVQIATRAGNDSFRFAGMRQQAAVRLELGDIAGFEAERRAMERLQERLGSWISSFWARAYRITNDILIGAFDDADRALDLLGADLGEETNAVTTWAGMQAMLRREQGRALEVVPTLDAAAAMFPTLAIFPVGAASFLAEGGALEEARPRYEALMADGMAAVPRDQTLVACAAGLAEVAVRLGDRDGAAFLRQVLEPYAGLLVTTGAATFCFASVHRLLGMLLAVEGRVDDALAAFEQALRQEESIGALPFASRTRRWYAAVLLARQHDGDVAHAAGLLAQALTDASRLGMVGLEAEVRSLVAGMM